MEGTLFFLSIGSTRSWTFRHFLQFYIWQIYSYSIKYFHLLEIPFGWCSLWFLMLHIISAHNNCNLKYKISKEIPIVFHNGSVYDYHFTIKQLAIEFRGKFDCLGENTEKYITFSAPIYKKMIMMKQSYTN